MRRFYYTVVIAIVFISCKSVGQSVGIHLAEREAKGRLLITIESENGKTKKYSADCFAKPVTKLPMDARLRLIEQLLEYEYNTMVCNTAPYKLSSLVTQLKKPTSDSFRIQVDALILINLIALGSDVFVYSPYPVLTLRNTGEEVYDQHNVSMVYKAYRKWFEKLKANKFENYSPPNLNDIGIRWFGGAFEDRIYMKPAGWSSYFDCIEL